MFAQENRPRIRQNHLKSSGNRRRLQIARAVYNTRLRFEPLEDRRLLSVGTWTGLSPIDNHWTTGDNWLGGVAPSAGDDLVFAAGAAQTANFNDFAAGTAFGAIQIAGDGYALTGNQVLLGGDVTSQGTGDSLGLDLQLSADHGIANTAGSTFTFSGAIDLNGHNLSVSAASGMTELDGQISGAGGLIIGGNGQSVLNAANSYTGVTTVNSGTLVVENALGLGAADGTAATGTVVENNATLQLEGSITVTGELFSSSSSASISSVGNNVWTGDMTVASELDVVSAAGNSLQVNGNITGAYLYNGYSSQLLLDGSANVIQYNAYNYGVLEVDGTLSTVYDYVYNYGGTLQGTGTVNASTQYGYPIYNFATLNPGTTSGPGILHTNNIYIGGGGNLSVRLNGAATAGTDYDQLDVTESASLAGTLSVTLGYTPELGDSFVIVNNVGTQSIGGTFNGLAQGSLLVVGADVFRISYTGGDGNDVVLTSVAADIWTGASITDSNWSDGGNWLSGVAPNPGDNLLFPAGAAQTTNVNDFAAGTPFGSIQISGDNYSLTGNQVLLGGNIISEGTGNSLGLNLQLSTDDGIANAAGSAFTVNSAIDLGGHNLSVSAASGTTELDGQISGAGGLIISGNGQSVLNAANSYTGATTVNSGTLVVGNALGLGATDGTAATGTDVEGNATLQLANSITVTGELLNSNGSATLTSVGNNVWTGDMTVASTLAVEITAGNSLAVDGNITGQYLNNYNYGGGQLILGGSANSIQYYVYNYGVLEVDGTLSTPSGYIYSYGTLRGTGTVNANTPSGYVYNYGTLSPGTASAPGILTANNIYNGGSFNVRLNGATAGTQYDQLDVTGIATLGGSLNASLGYTPALGDSFVIVNNEGDQPISGTFTGLPQGSLLVVGADVFQVSYTGGDGNDAVLTRVAADIWTGASIVGSNWSDGDNWSGDVAPIAGDSLIFPAGAAQVANVNDFAAGTAFGAIQIVGNSYSITGNQVLLGGNITSQGTGNSLGLDLQLSADEAIVNATSSTFTVSSAIDLNGHNLSVSTANASGTTEFDGAIGGAGGLNFGGSGKSILAAANSYTGVTEVNSGALIVRDALGLGAADGTAATGTDLKAGATLQLENSITVAGERLSSTGTSLNVTVRSVGNNVWTGDMAMAYQLTVQGAAGDSLEVDGNITGSYLYNHDAGGLVLHGSANVFQYYVYNYNLLDVDGTLSTQYYYVYDLNGGTLQGTGTVNASTLYGYYPVLIYGTLSPGTASGPGIFHTGRIQFGSGGNFNVRLNGAATAGTDYDQLDVTGSVTLGSAHLNVSLGYTPALGDSFLIVNNDGSDPVSGTFNSLAEGGLLVVGADVFQISYTGGDGNDVVLTRVEADIWTGASIAGSNWSDGDNWLGGVAPTAGDNLYFPAGPTQATTVNDFAAGTAFGFIQISGNNYSLTGNQVLLGGNITSQGTGNSLGLDLQLAADEDIVNAASNTFTVSGAIDLNGHNLSVSATDPAGTTELDGQISGTGGLNTGGSGQSVLNAANSYTGVTTVNSGTLVVRDAQGLGAADGTEATGTDVEGNATLQLENSITVANERLTSSGASNYVYVRSVGDNVWTGDMAVASYYLYAQVAAGNSLHVDGNITGLYLYNNDAGRLVLDGSANVLQEYVFNYGVLDVDGTLSITNYYVLNYSGGTLQGTGTIATSTLYGYYPVYNYGTLSPGTASGSGILNTGNMQLEGGGNFNVLLDGVTAGTGYSQLNVTGTVALGGTLNVSLGLGYTPTLGDSFLVLNNDGSDPISGTFTGLPQGGLLAVGADVFQISYTGGDGNDVVLTSVAADIWTGASIAGSNWTDGGNWVVGVAPNPGDNLFFPAGAAQTANVNDFAAGTAFGLIQIAGDGYSLTGNQVLLGGNIMSQGTGDSLGLNLQLAADEGIVNANTAGATFTVSSTIDLNGHILSVSAADSSGITELNGQISGAGGLNTGGAGQSVLNAANSYTGVTTVNSGTLVVENPLGLGAADGTADTGTDVANNAMLQLKGSITVAGELLTSSSNASVSSVGNNAWNGDIAVANTLYVNIDSGNALHVGGNITGQYLYLNTYNGGLLVLGGSANVVQYQVQNYYDVLEVDGSLSVPNGHVYNYGTLQGTGTVDTGLYNYLYNFGTLIPGTASAPGVLNTSTVYSNSNFNVLLNGTTAGTDYAQLNVTGSVYSYGNLNVSLGGGYTPTVGDTCMIIKNDGTDAVSGTFNGLAEGATINAGGYDFQISYVGGTGNDVVLKAITGNPDTTPPTATINQAVGQDDPTKAGTIHFAVVFSKMVSDFTASDISFTGSTATGPLTATLDTSDQITFDVAVAGMTGDGLVTIDFAAGAAVDGGGLSSEAPTVIDNSVTYDATPPATTASLDGTTSGNGWYTSDVMVTLLASDNLAGVQATYYALDGGPQQSYTTPFTVSGDGVHNISYWSVDAAGNAESANSLPVKIYYNGGQPLSLVVDTTADENDGNFSPGQFSLREAVMLANAFPDTTINFAPGLATQTITLGLGELELADTTGTTVIAGLGADQLTISGNNASRIFYVDGGVTADISGLTIADGYSSDFGGGIYNAGLLTVAGSTLSGNSAAQNGGGIFNNYGTLTLTNSTLSGNLTQSYGGGIFNNQGTLTLTDSTLSNNSVQDVAGGGIFNYGTLTLTGTTFSGNSANNGGGIFNNDGAVTVTGGTFSNNSASYGGGIYIQAGTVTVDGNTLSGNSAAYYGGGIYNQGTMTLTYSIFSGNTTQWYNGGGIYNDGTLTVTSSTLSENSAGSSGAGGGISNQGTATVADSTLSGNSAYYYGGGIYNPGTLTLTDSTLSGNSAQYYYGGGIHNTGTAIVTNSTIAGNSATYGSGGGIYNGSTTTLNNTIVAGNTGSYAPDIYGSVTANYSLIQDTTGTGFVNDTSTDILNQDPLLGTLGNHGGPTQTIPLLPGSPAIDKGSNSLAIDPDSQPLVYDQRGLPFARIVNGTVDIGAVEYSLAPAITSADHAALAVGVPGSFTVTATGFPIPALSLTGNVPLGVTLTDNLDGTASLSATQGGVFQLTITAGNGVDPDAVQSFTLTVQPGVPTITDPAANLLANTSAYFIQGTTTESDDLVRIYRDINGNGQIDGGDVVVASETLSGGATAFNISVPLLSNVDNYFLATASNPGGNESHPAVVPIITQDSVVPTVTLSAPSAPIAAGGPITYTVTYADANFNAITLLPGDVTLNVTGTANGTVGVSPLTSTTVLVTISGITGNGTLGITLAAGTASDLAGNLAPASAASDTFNVDNTPPTVTLSAPSAPTTAGGPITYTVTYADANFNAITLLPGDVTLNVTGDATGTVGVSVVDSTTRLVTISGITGNGTLGITLAAGTASDLAGNLAPASAPSGTFNVENGPVISLVVVTEANPQNGILESNEQGVITWAVTDTNPITSRSLTIDSVPASALGGPFGPYSGANYFYGLCNPVSVGVHSYTITVTDSLAHTTTYTNTFQVAPASAPAISLVVVAEANPQNGILESNEQGVITWAVTDPDPITSRSLTIDGVAASAIGGPYGPYSGANYFYGLCNPLSVGVHSYTITVTDSLAHTTTYTSTFQVAPASGPAISLVVVAEATPRNGILESNEQGVVTWAVTGPNPIVSKSLTVDGVPASALGGPLGPYGGAYYLYGIFGPVEARSHNFTITVTDSLTHTATYTGTFLVVSPLLVSAAVAPQGEAASLTMDQVTPIIAEAQSRLAATLGTRVLATLKGVSVQIADLPSGLLGEEAGKTIFIDRKAAGYGWFVDPTPADDLEFANLLAPHTLAAQKNSPAVQRVDLLTTVMHEMGHVLGYGDRAAADDLMSATLSPGVRRTLAVDHALSALYDER